MIVLRRTRTGNATPRGSTPRTTDITVTVDNGWAVASAHVPVGSEGKDTTSRTWVRRNGKHDHPTRESARPHGSYKQESFAEQAIASALGAPRLKDTVGNARRVTDRKDCASTVIRFSRGSNFRAVRRRL